MKILLPKKKKNGNLDTGLTKGKAYLANGLGTSFEDLKTAAEAYQKAIDLDEDVDDAKAGLLKSEQHWSTTLLKIRKKIKI